MPITRHQRDIVLLHTMCGATREMPACYMRHPDIRIPIPIDRATGVHYIGKGPPSLKSSFHERIFEWKETTTNDCGCQVYHYMEQPVRS